MHRACVAVGAPDSVRLQAAKFTEQLALLLTAPTAPPPPAGAAASAGESANTPSDTPQGSNMLCEVRMRLCGGADLL